MELSSWVEWCAVLGFALSLWNSVNDWRRRRVRIKLTGLEFYAMNGDRSGVYVFICGIASNPSTISASITEVSIKLDGTPYLHAERSEQVIMAVTSKPDRKHTEFTSTKLPINLPPYSAQEIVLLFHCKSVKLPPYIPLFPVGSHPEQESSVAKIPVRFRISTLSGTKRIRARASVCDYNDVMKRISKQNQMRA